MKSKSIQIQGFSSSPGVLKAAGRTFITMIIVIVTSFIWYSIRDRCDQFKNQGLVAWLQLIISWVILATVIAIQKPKNMQNVLIYTTVIGLLIGAVAIPCHEEGQIGDYFLDILQGITIAAVAGTSTYALSKGLKWY